MDLKSDGLKRVIIGGKSVVELESRVIPERTITIPEMVEYPAVRKELPEGTLLAGDTAIVSIQILDYDGNDKTPEDSCFKIPLDKYTSNPDMEVIGVLGFNFIERNKV